MAKQEPPVTMGHGGLFSLRELAGSGLGFGLGDAHHYALGLLLHNLL